MQKNFIALLFLIFPISGWSQEFVADNYVVTQYSLDEGLPQSSVNDIIQTKDGYIWLATYGGLVRFDGLSFTTFNRSNTPGIEWERIMRLFEDAEGGIWMITEQIQPEFYRFKDGKVEEYSLDRTRAHESQMYNDTEGRLWISAYNTLFKFNGESFTEFPITKVSSESDLKTNFKGTRIIVGKRMIGLGKEKAYELLDLDNIIEGRIIEAKESMINSEALIIGTRLGRFYKFEENKISEIDVDVALKGQTFINFGEGFVSDKRIYAVLFERIGLFDGSEIKNFNPIISKKKLSYKSILEDNEGNIWMGTNANGVFKLQPSVIEMIDQEQGLTTESMLSLIRLSDGTRLLSSNCGGVFELRNGTVSKSKVQDFFLSGCNWSVFQDSKDQIWIGGGELYVTSSLNEEGQKFGPEDGFSNTGVFAMMEDRNKNMWIGTGEGLYVYDGESFSKKYTESEGLYYRDSRALYEDTSGKIWVGTGFGLNTIKNNTVQKIPLDNINNNSTTNSQPHVRAIYQDVNSDMWIGTYGEGLFRIKGDSIQQLTENEGLFDNIISHIVEDKYGYFWMGSNRGISRVKRSDLISYLDGEINNFTISSFGSNDGMNSAETNGGFQPSTFTDEEGRIYFPTVSGVAIVDPDKVEKNTYSTPVYIEGLRSEESEFLKSDEIILSYNNGFLEIKYTGINFTAPEKIEFRYKMSGLDDDWIEVGKSRSAIYSKIPPGSYTFLVAATNTEGEWNNEGASFKIIVTPPFWGTYWFYGLVSLMLIGFVLFIINYKTSKLKEENEGKKRFAEQLIESQENERKRIASELHDGLGQQILVIKNRVELAKLNFTDDHGMIDQLNEIQHSADRSIEDVRNISHNLRPVLLEKFGLTDAVLNFCDQLEKSTNLEWSYHVDDIDDVFPKNKEINFYRILQEGANNILKHAESKHPSITITRTNNRINVTIYDDGKGYEASTLSKTKTGLGLIGINERVETLGGQLSVVSKKGEGTTIKIQIPIKKYE